MKLSVAKLVEASLLAAQASAELASVYLSSTHPHHPSLRSDLLQLNPSDARLVFAKRLGLSEYHSIDDASREAITALNTFGRSQRRIFGDDKDVRPQAVVLIEGVKDAHGR